METFYLDTLYWTVSDEKVLETKIDYIHRNPCMGKWNLADDYTLYKHSSASFYDNGVEKEFVTKYKEG